MRRRTLRVGLARLAVPLLLAPLAALVGTTAAHAGTAPAIGAGLPNLAVANVGEVACDNSLGGTGFGTSCTGDNGQPEYWSADFAEWVWMKEGIDVGGLTTPAGGSTAPLFWAYGATRGTRHTTAGYLPQVGDAVVYDSPADYVAIVTEVNADGTIQTTGGDWGGPDPKLSSVRNVLIPAGQSAVGDAPTPMSGKTIAGYVTPVALAGANPALTPFGTITWKPPGASTPRTDVYVKDAYGMLWDYEHTQGATATALPALGSQAEYGFGAYRPIGIGDMNQDGYPDLVAINTTTGDEEVFEGAASGLSAIPRQFGVGWWSNFVPYGVADYDHSGHLGVVAVDTNTGDMWFYQGDLVTGYLGREQIGQGWNGDVPFGVGDYSGDGHVDILACDTASNTLQVISGDRAGGVQPATNIYTGCKGQTSVGLTQYTTSGAMDLIVRDQTSGSILIDPASNGFGTPTSIGTSIGGNSGALQIQPFGAINWTPPRSTQPRVDLYGVVNGTLYDDTITPTTSPAPLPAVGTPIATGWTHYRPIGVADWNHDGYPDLIVIDTNTEAEDVFTGSANGISTTPIAVGVGWSSDFVPFGVPEWDHDGHYGVLTSNTATGKELFYPGDLTSSGGSKDPVTFGSGWTSAYVPFGVGYFSSGTHYDVLACRPDGALADYPGDGTEQAQPSFVVLTGCQHDTPIGIVDYTGSGRPDLIVRDNTTGNILVEQGNGAGGWTGAGPRTLATVW